MLKITCCLSEFQITWLPYNLSGNPTSLSKADPYLINIYTYYVHIKIKKLNKTGPLILKNNKI